MWVTGLQERFRVAARQFRGRGRTQAALVANRLAATVDDVPVSLMMTYIRLFESWDDVRGDVDWDKFYRAVSVEAAMAAACWINGNKHRSAP